MERSIISLHIGQGGVQMGQAIWELLTSEHEFSPTGVALNPDKVAEDDTFRAFYHLTEANQYVPRVLFVDLEPTCIDEIRMGPYKQLFHPDQLINGLEDAANNFSRGYFTQGKSIMVPYMNSLRKLAEATDSLQGFVVGLTMGGGTGAGFGSLVMEHLSANFPKTAKLQLFVNPSPNLVTCIVEPYNSILSTHYQFEHSDVSFMVDNESLYNICRDNLSIFSPTYAHINRIVAQLWSALTVSFRFEGQANTDLVALQTNIVPYPRIHFPVISYAPVINRARANHQSISVAEITKAVFEPSNQLISLDMNKGKFMAVSLLYRGDVSMLNVYKTLAGMKSNGMNFVDWCPTGFKVGINSMPPTVTVSSRMAPVQRNVTMLTNNTGIGTVWERINRKASTLFSKRAFVHSFVGDGMEEGEISDAIENINALVKDYHECGQGAGGGDADIMAEPSYNEDVHVGYSDHGPADDSE